MRAELRDSDLSIIPPYGIIITFALILKFLGRCFSKYLLSNITDSEYFKLNLKHHLKYIFEKIPNFCLSHSIPPQLQINLFFLKFKRRGTIGRPCTPKKRITSTLQKQSNMVKKSKNNP